MTADHKVQLFISHVSEEQAEALKAKDYLEKVFAGHVEVFVASSWTSIAPGEDWFSCVTEAIDRAEIMLVMCSGDSVNRPWIQFETGAGWFAKKAKVIPVCHRGMTPGALPEPIRRLQAVDINATTEAEWLRKLADVVKKVADLPEPTPFAAASLPTPSSSSTASLKGWFTRPNAHIGEEHSGVFKVGSVAASDADRATAAGLNPEDTIFVRLFQEPPTGQYYNTLAQGRVAELLERDDAEGAVITVKLKLSAAFAGQPDQRLVPIIVILEAVKRPG